jgi:hypothetical protein
LIIVDIVTMALLLNTYSVILARGCCAKNPGLFCSPQAMLSDFPRAPDTHARMTTKMAPVPKPCHYIVQDSIRSSPISRSNDLDLRGAFFCHSGELRMTGARAVSGGSNRTHRLALVIAVFKTDTEITEKLLSGYKIGDKTCKVHIDGYNLLPYLSGEAKKGPRKFFFYISDDGDILALRMGDWKMVLMEQRAKQLMCWFEPFVKLRAPKMFNLRRDPLERADENSNT